MFRCSVCKYTTAYMENVRLATDVTHHNYPGVTPVGECPQCHGLMFEMRECKLNHDAWMQLVKTLAFAETVLKLAEAATEPQTCGLSEFFSDFRGFIHKSRKDIGASE